MARSFWPHLLSTKLTCTCLCTQLFLEPQQVLYLGSWCSPPFLTLWGMFVVSWAQLRVYCTNLRICYIPLKSVNFCFRWQSIRLDSTQALPFPRQPNSQFSSIFSSAATIDSPSDARGFEMSLRLKQSVHRTWHLPLPVSSQEFSPRFPSALSLSFTPES